MVNLIYTAYFIEMMLQTFFVRIQAALAAQYWLMDFGNISEKVSDKYPITIWSSITL